MSGSNRLTADPGYRHRLQVSVFQWKGSWHVLAERIEPSGPGMRSRRRRVAHETWDWPPGEGGEAEAVEATIRILSAVLARLRTPSSA